MGINPNERQVVNHYAQKFRDANNLDKARVAVPFSINSEKGVAKIYPNGMTEKSSTTTLNGKKSYGVEFQFPSSNKGAKTGTLESLAFTTGYDNADNRIHKYTDDGTGFDGLKAEDINVKK